MDVETLCGIAADEVAMIVKVLPEGVREHAERCLVSYEAKPMPGEDIEEDILGLFEGASLIDEPSPESMPRIRIFVGNLWDFTERDEQDFRDEVGTTFLHELGHYLGWDEDEVADRGLE